MKKRLACRVTIFLLLGWGVLSVIGYERKNDIYKDYMHDVATTPYFVLVLQGLHDGIYPWSMSGEDTNPSGEMPGEEIAATELSSEPDTEEPPVKKPPVEVKEEKEEEAPLPKEFVAVERDYFSDAVFIGDSRTVGLRDYGGLDEATFYATVGLNIYDMWGQKFCEVEGEKLTLEEALSESQFKKVYFQIGINEMGRGTIDTFMEEYRSSVAKIRELLPDAIIYVQGIMRVTKKKSERDPIFNNPGINARNERIAQLADGQKIFYIDANDALCDEEGNLRADLTFDDLHLYGSKYGLWVDFLLTKGIE
ncbi:MAG: GDSL-type esterase/lipase family protein [Clostridiales bacterium]|nr:GDSL-type esterase/lipase family protein [Clostridiales bacterium]